jgi:hypothetical protein
VELALSVERVIMSDFIDHNHLKDRVGASVMLAIAGMRCRRAFVDLRSRVYDDRAGDFTYKTALFSAVFVCDLILVIAIFSL